MNPVPPYRPAPVSWWIRLLTLSPSEQEAERQARMPAPAPHRRDAHKGPIQAAESTQAGRVGLSYRLGRRSEP